MDAHRRDHGRDGDHRQAIAGAARAGDPETDTVDPACGMPVSPDTAAARRDTTVGTSHFCSTGCADTFDTDPGRYGNVAVNDR